MTLPKLAEIRKLLVYIAGVAAAALATGLLPANVAAVVDSILALLTGVGIHQVRNDLPGLPPAG